MAVADAHPHPDPAHHFDADANPDPAYHIDADVDPDPDPTFQFSLDPSGSGSGFTTLLISVRVLLVSKKCYNYLKLY